MEFVLWTWTSMCFTWYEWQPLTFKQGISYGIYWFETL